MKKTAIDEDDDDKSPAPSGGVDPKVQEILEKALQDASKSDAFDYLKFRDTVESLKDTIDDEDTRFKVALKTAKTMKIKPSDLVDSAQEYVDVVKTEKKNMLDAIDEQSAEHDKAEKDAKDTSDQIAELESQIADL